MRLPVVSALSDAVFSVAAGAESSEASAAAFSAAWDAVSSVASAAVFSAASSGFPEFSGLPYRAVPLTDPASR